MSKKQESWRHHYIPIFYLKNFTKNGRFFVFDKEIYDFPRNPHKSPRQVCFEEDRNTLYLGKEKLRNTDLEDVTYQYLDSDMAQTLNELNNSTLENFKWRDELVGSLEHFISLLFWRIPTNDERFTNIVQKSTSIEEFGILAVNNETGEREPGEQLHQLLLEDKKFHEAMKPVFSYTSMMKELPKSIDNWEWRVIYWHGNNPRLTSDNPLLFKDEVSEDSTILNKVILPLSADKTLIKLNKDFGDDTNPYSAFFQDMAIFHSAKKYVMCSDQKYLALIARHYATLRNNNMTNQILPRLFESFNEFG